MHSWHTFVTFPRGGSLNIALSCRDTINNDGPKLRAMFLSPVSPGILVAALSRRLGLCSVSLRMNDTY